MNQKKLITYFQFIIVIFLFSCCNTINSEEESQNRLGQAKNSSLSERALDYRQEMRDFVIALSQYSKALTPGFAVIPQNGIELVTVDGEGEGDVCSDYLAAIDGHGQEDLYYGYDEDNIATPAEESDWLESFLDISRARGNTILTTDYCWSQDKMDRSYEINRSKGYISFAADDRDLLQIPAYPTPIYNENSGTITALNEAKNFLYLINFDRFSTKAELISAVRATNYDLLITDLFFDDEPWTTDEVEALKSKANGGKRMVICYMSIGEAENYRYYWQNSWTDGKGTPPAWLDKENPAWEGNFKVKYWQSEWQNIIYGNDDSYLKKIIDSDFDGVYLDIIDAYEYFEG